MSLRFCCFVACHYVFAVLQHVITILDELLRIFTDFICMFFLVLCFANSLAALVMIEVKTSQGESSTGPHGLGTRNERGQMLVDFASAVNMRIQNT